MWPAVITATTRQHRPTTFIILKAHFRNKKENVRHRNMIFQPNSPCACIKCTSLFPLQTALAGRSLVSMSLMFPRLCFFAGDNSRQVPGSTERLHHPLTGPHQSRGTPEVMTWMKDNRTACLFHQNTLPQVFFPSKQYFGNRYFRFTSSRQQTWTESLKAPAFSLSRVPVMNLNLTLQA